MASASAVVGIRHSSGSRSSLEDAQSIKSGGAAGGGPKKVLLSGWLLKWTNYIKGYRQRWFTINDDAFLRYFRSPADVDRSVRGAVNLANSFVHTENTCNFTLTSGHTTFHLKAPSEAERQKWVTQIGLCKFKQIKREESDEEQELKLEKELNDANHTVDMQGAVSMMQAKLRDTRTCHDMLERHGTSLQKTLVELETQLAKSKDQQTHEIVKRLGDRMALFKITTEATIHACDDYVTMAQNYNDKWQQLLSYEHEQRKRLESQFQRLAKDHFNLEQVAMNRTDLLQSGEGEKQDEMPPIPTTPVAVYSESDDETDFHDALDDVSWGPSSASGSMRTNKSKLRRAGSTGSADAGDETMTGDNVTNDVEDRAAQQHHNLVKRQQSQANQSYFNATIVTSSRGGEPAVHKSRDSSMERDSSVIHDKEASSSNTAKNMQVAKVKPSRVHRTELPPKPNSTVSLWSIMRNCIGKELSKIPMPVNFNEPLSFLQRITEDMEYAHLLDRAASKTDPCEQLCYVAAFTVSMYSTSSGNRATKPFNPLLGETYECDRMDDLGWRSIAEQVSHHPPVAAHHCESRNGWYMMQEFSMTSKFRGKYLSVIPTGVAHIHFKDTGNHYTYRRVTTTVHNIIVGKLWIDHHGETTIENHTTGDKCIIKYQPYSYFSTEEPRKVTALVQDKHGQVKYLVQGTWDGHLDCLKVIKTQDAKSAKPVLETERAKRIWQKNPLLPNAEKFYNFTALAIQLNELEDGVAPTDSRNRPDQRLMEQGDWEKANSEKVRLEDKQRKVRRQKEAEAEKAMQQASSGSIAGLPVPEYTPCWFTKKVDDWEGGVLHMYNDQYWPAKEKQTWDKCPSIF